MSFRNARYLDVPLLGNLADYHGVQVPDEAEVTRRVTQERGSTLGMNKIVEARREGQNTEEVTESYVTTLRPIRFMNDVVDHLLDSGIVIDLVADPTLGLVQRAVIQVEGELVPSPANEIGSLMDRFMPLLIAQAASGAKDFKPSGADLAQTFFSPQSPSRPQVFDIESDSDVRLVALLEPGHLHGDATLDDLG